jgi:hypothetical protein
VAAGVPMPGEWTLEAARAALPEVRLALEEARGHLAVLRACEEQLQDLRIVHGEQVLAVASPGHAEFRAWWDRYHAARHHLELVLLRLTQMGAEVKDVGQGLVDFRGLVGDRPAYLCWKEGEADVGYWHPLDEGFAGRRPLPPASAQEGL